MSETKDIDKPLAPDLEVEQDLEFLRRKWAAERIGWVVFALIILGALLGLLGSGPLANAETTGSNGERVGYERFVHREAPTTLRIDPGGSVSEQGTVDVAFSLTYAQNMNIQRIIPEPDSENMAGDELVYSFTLDEQEGSPSEVVFQLEYEDAGQWEGQVTINDGNPLTINQIVYP